jgi:hypothetical protein
MRYSERLLHHGNAFFIASAHSDFRHDSEIKPTSVAWANRLQPRCRCIDRPAKQCRPSMMICAVSYDVIASNSLEQDLSEKPGPLFRILL